MPTPHTKGKVCARCGTEENLTRDHIIPKWIYKAFPWKQIGMKKNWGENNIQILCSNCNQKKGNLIDCSHERGRMFWTAVRDEIDRQLLPPKS